MHSVALKNLDFGLRGESCSMYHKGHAASVCCRWLSSGNGVNVGDTQRVVYHLLEELATVIVYE
jgi:hypothetical protein